MNKPKHVRKLDLFLFDGAGAASGGGDGTGAGDASGEAQATPADTGVGSGANNGAETVMDAEKARREEFERLIGTDYKDLYAEKTQKLIDRRFRQTKELEDNAKKTAPILERLADKYGEKDLDKLLNAIDSDDSYYEQEAVERGMSVEQLKAFKSLERENAAFKAAKEEQDRRDAANATYNQWIQQGEQVKQIYPSFDLQTECQNDTFISLLQNGIDVKTAYEVIHRDEILAGAMAYTAQQTREKMAGDIRARGLRPQENGLSGGAAVATKTDVSKMTKAERDEIEKRVLRGERIVL